jgi:RNA ligase
MHYNFPQITHLDQVLEAIQGVDGFIVAQRDWGTVVNYVQMGPDLFPEVHTAGGSASMREKATLHKAIRRECRGLIFNKQGELVSRPLHKFWNAGERRETLLENIDLSKPHIILDKMDGSMIRPIPITGGTYRLGTKMGITDVAQQAERYVANKSNINTFILGAIGAGYTPIFEWCSRQQRIVIDYPEDRLVLIAVRHVLTGEYLTYQQMQELAGEYDLDLVRAYTGTVENMQQLVNETRALEDQEGWVIRWDDGHMVKLKADSYVKIHRAKDALMQEKNLIDLIISEKLDDVKSFLPQEDLTRVENYERDFWQGVAIAADTWKKRWGVIKVEHGSDRKSFALDTRYQNLDGNLKSAVFRHWDNAAANWQEAVLDVIRRSCSSSNKIEGVRHLFGCQKWTNSAGGGGEE